MAASQSDWSNTKVNAIYDGGTQAVQFTIVKRVLSTVDPSDGKIHVTPITGATDVPYGVIQENPKTGEACTVVVIGGTKIAVGAAVLGAGDFIMTNATGYALTYATGGGTSYNLGVCDVESQANGITSAIINCATPVKGL